MIYLVGVDHRAQRKKREDEMTDCQREFESVVESAMQSIQLGLLAEEDHPDFLSRDEKDSILLMRMTPNVRKLAITVNSGSGKIGCQ